MRAAPDDIFKALADPTRRAIYEHLVSDGEQTVRALTELGLGSFQLAAQRAREMLATYREAEDLLAIGAYKRGAVPRLDEALDYMPALEGFLRQRFDEPSTPEQTRMRFAQVWKSRA